MQSITKTPNIWLKNNKIALTFVRNHWLKDYKPGPYPLTEKEKIEAAKKYGVHPSEYKVYDDDGQGYGDYPKLPRVSIESRDPFYPWDNPELKRNYNEPLHAEYEVLREDRYDVSVKLRRPLGFLFFQTICTFAGAFLLYSLCSQVKMFPAVLPQQYPQQGKTHYTFEKKQG